MKLVLDASKDYLDSYFDTFDFKPRFSNTTELVIKNLRETSDYFLENNETLRSVSLPDTVIIGYGFLSGKSKLDALFLPQVEIIKDQVLTYNDALIQIDLPKVKIIGHSFLTFNESIVIAKFPVLTSVGDDFFDHNAKAATLDFPHLKTVGDNFLNHCDAKELRFPKLEKVGNGFLEYNHSLDKLYLPKLKQFGADFLSLNNNYQYFTSSKTFPSEAIDTQTLDLIKEMYDKINQLAKDFGDIFLKLSGIENDFGSARNDKHWYIKFKDDCLYLPYDIMAFVMSNYDLSTHLSDIDDRLEKIGQPNDTLRFLRFQKIGNINIIREPELLHTLAEYAREIMNAIDIDGGYDKMNQFQHNFSNLKTELAEIGINFYKQYYYFLRYFTYALGSELTQKVLKRSNEQIIESINSSKTVYPALQEYLSKCFDVSKKYTVDELLNIERIIQEEVKKIDRTNFFGSTDDSNLEEELCESDYDDFYKCKWFFHEDEGLLSSVKCELGKTLKIPPKINGVAVVEFNYECFYKNHLTSVTIPEGVIKIGDSAFCDNNLTEITIPESVVEISRNAFSKNQLLSVKILGDEKRFNNNWKDTGFPIECLPGYTLVDKFVFDGCGTIVDYIKKDYFDKPYVEVPDEIKGIKVKKISNDAFSYKDIVGVTLPQTLEMIGDGAFSHNKLQSVKIPDSVMHIGRAAFADNELTEIIIPSKILELFDYAFASNKLSKVKLPSNILKIGNNAFRDNQLVNIQIPESVIILGEAAFEKNRITSIIIPPRITKIEKGVFADNEIEEINIPNNIIHIGEHAFKKNKLKTLIIPDTVTTIDCEAFDSNELRSVQISKNVSSIARVFSNNKIGEVIIPDHITNISGAFSNNKIESILIPEGINTIDSCAFEGNEISDLKLPSSMTKIGYRAFASNKIKKLQIPGAVTEIELSAFGDNPIVEIRILGEEKRFNNIWSTTGFPFDLVPGYEVINDFVVDNTGAILKFAATNNRGIASFDIEIPIRINDIEITVIDDNAFNGNGIDRIIIPKTIKKIGKFSFYQNRIRELIIPDSVTSIGPYAFYANWISKLTLSQNINTIEDDAFAVNCLKSIVIPANVTEIGKNAFSHNDLKTVVIPNKVVTIGPGAFQSNKILQLKIGESVIFIEDSAFRNNNIENLVIPSKVEKIGGNAFGENKIKSVLIEGNASRFDDDWSSIGFPDNAKMIISK